MKRYLARLRSLAYKDCPDSQVVVIEQPPTLLLSCRLSDELFCAKCCYNTEMPLTSRDIERLKKLGYRVEYFAIKTSDGVWRLRNIDGHCVFLDTKTGACRVYPYRPEGCRLYPLVYDVDNDSVAVDSECPLARCIPVDVAKRLEKSVIKLVEEIYKGQRGE